MDRVFLSFPIHTGEIAIVANAVPSAEEWQTLLDLSAIAKRAFERSETPTPEPQADPVTN